ncbi:MAG: hypothetical protein IPI72_11795 [Flavobacteriales bacterium]|nr:hypothetical protein [Flavobacteriales bacterium]
MPAVDSMALAIALDHPELGPKELAHAYQNVGFIMRAWGHHQAAIRSICKPIGVRASSDPSYLDLSECYNGAGVSSWHLGRTRAAEGYYREALAKLERSKDPDALLRKAGIVSNMGIMWQDAGDIPRSRANYQEGIRLSTEMIAQATDPTTRASAILSRSKGYVNLATVYFSLGTTVGRRSYWTWLTAIVPAYWNQAHPRPIESANAWPTSPSRPVT